MAQQRKRAGPSRGRRVKQGPESRTLFVFGLLPFLMVLLALIGGPGARFAPLRWPGTQARPAPAAQRAHRLLSGTAQQEQWPWMLRLVDEAHPVTLSDVPALAALPNGMQVDSRILDPLETMLGDARDAGLEPVVCSAYRTAQEQRALFEEEVERLVREGTSLSQAVIQARFSVARPGASEHQLGIAVDIVSMSHQLLDDAQADTPEARWLAAHCHEYGFILRYPDGKSGATGVRYEPWHFRYVGREAAEEIMSDGLCLEEYLAAFD